MTPDADVFHDLDAPVPDGKYVYHYTSAATAALILESRSLRMGPYSQTNDPRERQAWFPTLFGDPELSGEAWLALCRKVDEALRQRAHLACFTMDDRCGEALPVTSFHRGWARARMWDQYAARHTGVCFVLNRERWESAVADAFARVDNEGGPEPLIVHGRVDYLDRAVNWGRALEFDVRELLSAEGVLKAADEHLRKHSSVLFLQKNTDWATEREYRSIAVAGGDHHDIPLQGCLAGIVVGEHYPSYERAVLQHRLDLVGLEVPITRCVWHVGAPQHVPYLP